MRKLLLVGALLTMIAGCSNAPSHFIINTAPAISSNSPVVKNIAINVIDPRSRQAILRLTDAGKHSYLSSNIPTAELVKQGFGDHIRQQLAIGTNPTSSSALSITIDKMALKLDQGVVSYETQSLIVFNIAINKGTKMLNKTFKRQGTSKGPLKADIAVLEREFSALLVQIYNDMSNDSQVRSYLAM